MSDELSPEEQLAEQQLLQEYVKARISQATDDLERLHAALLADPKNFEKANKLMKAFADVRALRAELSELSTEMMQNEPTAMSTQATAGFRAAQAQKAQKVMQAAGMRTKECDKCHAILPDRAALCFCGHRFAQADTDASAQTDIGSEQRRGL
jgi:hypothetical protein